MDTRLICGNRRHCRSLPPEGQVGNLADAIASGALRASPAFREMIADLPNAIKRDVDRARATVRQYTGYSIRVESDGKTVRRKAQIHQHPSRCAYLRHCRRPPTVPASRCQEKEASLFEL
jgi:hypothetical protein